MGNDDRALAEPEQVAPAQNRFRRLIYASVAVTDDARQDHLEILGKSRANNGIDGVSGFLWTDGVGYLQVLEGPPEAVASTLNRIMADPRHNDVRIVSDQLDDGRAFGDWVMASVSVDRNDELLRERVRRFLRNAPDDVRTAFAKVKI